MPKGTNVMPAIVKRRMSVQIYRQLGFAAAHHSKDEFEVAVDDILRSCA